MGEALVTDLYEVNMAASYLARGLTKPATFSLFVRDLPPERGFLVAAGLEDCLAFLESFAFAPEDLAWLEGAGYERAVEQFASLRFSGDVHAVHEGRVVLAGEPLLEVTAPLPVAQLVETYLLNQVTFQSALATKAARCRLAAGDIELVDFALRRTHGTEAGMAAARAGAIAGFTGTSNVEAARCFGLRAAGTVAHSYIQAFPTEREAFVAMAEDLHGPLTFLVDTYDTLAGVRTAIEVIGELDPEGPLAVRLDSGDLAQLARETRRLLDAAGLSEVRIFATGGLDEEALARFVAQDVPIDAAGLGTRVGVSADAPYLDSVYKLVAYDGRPVRKLSAGKATLPGAKQVWRGGPGTDLLTLRDEPGPSDHEPLLVPVMAGGRRTGLPGTIATAQQWLADDLAWLPAEARRLHAPVAPRPHISPALEAEARRVAAAVSGASA